MKIRTYKNITWNINVERSANVDFFLFFFYYYYYFFRKLKSQFDSKSIWSFVRKGMKLARISPHMYR